jgi:hypothetical protein
MKRTSKAPDGNTLSRTDDLLQRADRALAASDRLINQTRQLLERWQAIRGSTGPSRVQNRASTAAG